ncbi:MAG: HAD family hydrolase [Candidatus Zhuqueibacterota bacterium]
MKLIMFDVDGTLTDTTAVDARCFIVALNDAFRIAVAEIDWSKYKYVSDEGLSSEIFEEHFHRPPTREEMERVKNSYVRALQREIAASRNCSLEIPGAVAAMQRLKQLPQYAVSIATGCWKESAALKLQTAGFDFEKIPMASSSDSIERTVIMQMVLDRAREQYRTDHFEQVVYVGDGVWDATASAELNYQFIGVGVGAEKEKLIRAGARVIIPNYLDFELFEKLLTS